MKLLKSVYTAMDENAYIYFDENTKEGVLIDPGGEGDKICRAIDANGIRLKGILLTHAHGDHIGALPQIKEKYQAPVVIHKQEEDMLENPDLNMSGAFGNQGISMKGDILLEDGDSFEISPNASLKAILIMGHTNGGVCYYDSKTGVLFSGDNLFYGSIGRTDFPQFSRRKKAQEGIAEKSPNENMETLVTMLKEKVLTLPDDTRVYPGHGMATSIMNEKKYNPFLR